MKIMRILEIDFEDVKFFFSSRGWAHPASYLMGIVGYSWGKGTGA
jgi:hypothetical protein